jgi:hypothetical protein
MKYRTRVVSLSLILNKNELIDENEENISPLLLKKEIIDLGHQM